MDNEPAFYKTAKSLSRNPLGIIALFIVLVYAVASILVGNAKPPFYQEPYHPVILFLAIFPVLVLIAFTILVAFYHRNLYAPQDYKNEAHFFGAREIPATLGMGPYGISTSDKYAPKTNAEIHDLITKSYTELLTFGFALVHQVEVISARTSPNSGRYRVRVWVEAIDRKTHISDIESVTYHVWPDFPSPVVTTTNSNSNFDLWLSVYGEFPVLALVTTKSGDRHLLQRYIELPGRPPD